MKAAEIRQRKVRNEQIREYSEKNPDLGPTEIAELFGNISRQRVTQILNPHYRKWTPRKEAI